MNLPPRPPGAADGLRSADPGRDPDLSALHLDGRTVSLDLSGGLIKAITPVPGPARAVILPLPVDPHVHLDKAFTIQRCRAAKPGLLGAIEAMAKDMQNWTAEDLRRRAGRALAEAHASGIAALRSHVDWERPTPPLAWEILGELAQDWRRSVWLQRAALVSLDLLGDAEAGPGIAARVARDGAVLGCFVYRNADLEAKLARVMALVDRHDLRVDFHVDEGLDPLAQGFDAVVDLATRHGLGGRVLCGHACSLAIRPTDEVARVIDRAAAAGVTLTVLPTTNLHLQDMQTGRSPRQRGLAPMHEMRAAGVPLCLGADNVADPFYPHGSFDQIEVLRLACLAAHLAPADWLDTITTLPAASMGLPVPAIAPGAPADFILIAGPDWDAALRTGRARRRIFRAGQESHSGKCDE